MFEKGLAICVSLCDTPKRTNCGRYLHGNLRADGSARLKCQSCGLIIVRTVKSRRRCELQLLAVEKNRKKEEA